ncbi:arginine--tRNA ligase ArgS [Paenibacillus larvae subsp. larvae]|uniref:Arginine--tRNA ligase n=2 Tax=Paenibacillus larvae TaxID=1464 RepID=A0A6C0QYJ8_9BACL|nr:arginine--tRNA ligase ArgS [Paenibacillus larvae subsp. larvae]
MSMLTKYAAHLLKDVLPLDAEDIHQVLEPPPSGDMGDVAFPCFHASKLLRKPPAQIAAELAAAIHAEGVRAEAAGPYINLFFTPSVYGDLLLQGMMNPEFGKPDLGQGKRAIIDMSSPNIAKPFGIGHLRSTVIGNALYNLYKETGFEPVSVNHLGDWGTQFGKQICAYKHWGSEEKLKADPIRESLELYVRFHEEAEQYPELEDEARGWFRKLETGDEDAKRLWEYFVKVSLNEFERMYDKLGVKFDHTLGESFYNDKIVPVIKALKEQNLLEESDGAYVVRLDEEGMPPCLITKSDGTTIYPTRDLATAIYRHDVMKGDKLLYVVGGEQKLHFKQVFAVLGKLGKTWVESCEHVPFGLMKFAGKKMSTRRGRVVSLEEVLQEAVNRAREIIEEKNPLLPDKEHVAEAVGIGAIVFGDLKNNRVNEIDFSLDEALNFDGETGPYVQYTFARTQSVLAKAEWNFSLADCKNILSHSDLNSINHSSVWQLIKQLSLYPQAIERAVKRNEPSVVARYALETAKAFNRFYNLNRILAEDEKEQKAKLIVTTAAAEIIRRSLHLLGLKTPKQM